MLRSNLPSTIITEVNRAHVGVADEMHFTGGLRGRRGMIGWHVGPVIIDDNLKMLEGIPDENLRILGKELGVDLFGAEEIINVDSDLPSRIWTPLLGPPRMQHQAADTWGMIASTACRAGDSKYAKLALSLAISIRAAGLQLRNVSDQYHKQLVAALKRGDKPGTRFANVALTELHLACHSLLSELGSARDYIASVAARRVGAPDKIDALSRLKDWAGKSVNAATVTDPFVARLFADSDEAAADPWLADIGNYRNLFLHRQPLGANDRANRLSLNERKCEFGAVRTIYMEVEVRPSGSACCDALTRFVDLHARLCRLADSAAPWAAYPPLVPHFEVQKR